MRKLVLASAMAALVLQPTVAVAGNKDFAMQGYALPKDKPVTIVLMRPDVNVGELQAGGLPQPNADWTNAAREQIEKALKAELAGRNIAFSNMEEAISALKTRENACAAERARFATAQAAQQAAATQAGQQPVPPSGSDSAAQDRKDLVVIAPVPDPNCALFKPGSAEAEALMADYRGLHGAVVDAILAHKYNYGGGKLPTQKAGFSYTLGPGTGQLGTVAGANYGIFVLTIDQFASGGRKAMQVMGALGCLIGACMIVGGGIHVAYVSLVELDTGNIVWFNVMRGSQGDVREEQGARDMVKAILATMPSRPGELMVAPAVKKSK